MLIFAFLSLVGSIFSFFLGVFVYSKNPKEKLNLLFMLFCSSFFIMGLAEYGMRTADNYEIALIWAKIGSLHMFPVSFLFHFSIIFFEKFNKIIKKLLYLSIYFPAAFFINLALSTDIFEKGPIKKYWGWTFGAQDSSLVLNIYYFWMFGLIIFSFILFFWTYYKKPISNKTYQAKFILAGSLISFLIFYFTDFTNFFSFQIEIPEFGIFGFTICVGFIAYAMVKYQLFVLDFSNITDKIMYGLSDALILLSPNHKIKDVNQTTLRLLDYQKKELIDQPIYTLFSEDDIKNSEFNEFLKQKIGDSNFIRDIEKNFKTKYGKRIPFSMSISFVKDNWGEIQGIIVIGRDITEYKKVMNEILIASQFKTELMSSVSHELRTPLNSIIGFTDLLLEQVYGPLNDKQIDFLQDIQFSSEYLLNLINNILDITKIDSGKLKLNFERINLSYLIYQIKTSLVPLYSSKNLDFNIEGLTGKASVYMDAIRFKEILYNLLSNAFKYTLEGSVTLKIIENEDFWEFKVRDTGIGIDKKDYNLIFKAFKRVSNPIVSSINGSGLGLSITKKLINLHGGNITFSSELGKGTVFTFTIPKKGKIIQ